MKQAGLGRFLIATSAVAFATLFSVGWSEQRGISLSVESAQARARLYVNPYLYSPYRPDATGLSWYAVRAYYAGGLGPDLAIPTPAGLAMRNSTALSARPAALSKAATASITSASRQPG